MKKNEKILWIAVTLLIISAYLFLVGDFNSDSDLLSKRNDKKYETYLLAKEVLKDSLHATKSIKFEDYNPKFISINEKNGIRNVSIVTITKDDHGNKIQSAWSVSIDLDTDKVYSLFLEE